MSRIKHSALVLLLCLTTTIAGVIPAATTYAMSAGAGAIVDNKEDSQKETTDGDGENTTNPANETGTVSLVEAKRQALKELKDHYNATVVGMDAGAKAEAKKLYDNYRKAINNVSTTEGAEGTLEIAKSAITDAGKNDGTADDTPGTDNTPTSSSDLIMVGGNWITPVARAGQAVNVVLPVVNMMQGVNLNNVIVTPVVSTTTSEWPFEIQTSGYTQTIADLPGAGNGQSDMDRRRELTWTFQTKRNVMNGYYKVPFLVNYTDPGSRENVQVTLTTYVLCVGAPGAGNVAGEDEGKYATPRVIVTGYDTNPAEIHAGDTFTLTLHLKNTSMNTSVSNMLVHLTTPTEGTDSDNTYAAFLPTSGSNTFYVEKIGRGGTTDLSIEMNAKNDLTQKPYSLDVSMDYEDENINSFTSTADISIMVKQTPKFELSAPEVMPAEITVGDQANVMMSIYNTGRVTLYNVHVGFEADSVSAEDTYIGKIEAGGTGNVDTMITGQAPTMDDGTVKIIVTYEDEDGKKQTYEQDMTLMVNEMPMMDDMAFDEGFVEEEPSGFPGWIIAVIVVLVIAGVVVAVIVIKKIKKKKNAAEIDDLLDGIEDVEETAGNGADAEKSTKSDAEE